MKVPWLIAISVELWLLWLFYSCNIFHFIIFIIVSSSLGGIVHKRYKQRLVERSLEDSSRRSGAGWRLFEREAMNSYCFCISMWVMFNNINIQFNITTNSLSWSSIFTKSNVEKKVTQQRPVPKFCDNPTEVSNEVQWYRIKLLQLSQSKCSTLKKMESNKSDGNTTILQTSKKVCKFVLIFRRFVLNLR